MLLTAEHRTYPAPGQSPPDWIVDVFWRHTVGVPGHMRGQPVGPPPDPTELTGPGAVAYVNHGRWIARCPHGCGSAQLASRSTRRFLCVHCSTPATAAWSPVVWPDDETTIEQLLDVRPAPADRNWRPPTTVDALSAENTKRGWS